MGKETVSALSDFGAYGLSLSAFLQSDTYENGDPYFTLISAYKSKNNTILVLSEDNIWYFANENSYTCTFEKYEDSVLTIQMDKQSFSFKVLDENTIYDLQEEEFLRRGDTG